MLWSKNHPKKNWEQIVCQNLRTKGFKEIYTKISIKEKDNHKIIYNNYSGVFLVEVDEFSKKNDHHWNTFDNRIK